ncbi:hypothetical protein VNO78_16828 [Psophocarpus tetragonolobus]|uniref:Uncharacterized protein n=1 Tax=Psophocarpus tetragonolobus TaxID=3891 RepID=A0AAN9SHN4_PSOTE
MDSFVILQCVGACLQNLNGVIMHDEAATHYIDMIDQTALRHKFLKVEFGVTRRIAASYPAKFETWLEADSIVEKPFLSNSKLPFIREVRGRSLVVTIGGSRKVITLLEMLGIISGRGGSQRWLHCGERKRGDGRVTEAKKGDDGVVEALDSLHVASQRQKRETSPSRRLWIAACEEATLPYKKLMYYAYLIIK